MTQDNLLERLKAANNIVDKAVFVLDRWGPGINWQETFAGIINMDRWQEDYAKNLAKPNIRQQVEDRVEDRIKDKIQMKIRMDVQKSWKERGL
jgi:hypothetical protein